MYMTPKGTPDPEYPTSSSRKGDRKDKRNLIDVWMKAQQHKSSQYVWHRKQFDEINVKTTDRLLGLFEPKDMRFEVFRNATRDPSIGTNILSLPGDQHSIPARGPTLALQPFFVSHSNHFLLAIANDDFALMTVFCFFVLEELNSMDLLIKNKMHNTLQASPAYAWLLSPFHTGYFGTPRAKISLSSGSQEALSPGLRCSVCVYKHVDKLAFNHYLSGSQTMKSTCSRLQSLWTLRPTAGRTWPSTPKAPWPTSFTGSKSRTISPTPWPTQPASHPTRTAHHICPPQPDTHTPSLGCFSVWLASSGSCSDDDTQSDHHGYSVHIRTNTSQNTFWVLF
ncbi:unnamed protein product [Oncorhynchus mykiss]|uniref:alkaline phosphatase n=1 Tax=Oncorhynchus mykiss TaxID=8022 RepID=A0A060YJE5_ONCMY|nr:unnamed protein product [Oncorhynchus mykiss]